MAVDTKCPHCGMPYRLPESQLGRSVRCGKCEQPFEIKPSRASTRKSQAAQETGRAAGPASSGAEVKKLGRFEIRSKLGARAFGAVYRAYDPLLEREVALKVPHPGALESEQDKARYLREPKAAANLRHPNIVPIFDAGLDGDHFFIASAFIQGQPLEREIADRRPDFRRAATTFFVARRCCSNEWTGWRSSQRSEGPLFDALRDGRF